MLRVFLDGFDHFLGEIWQGFLNPDLGKFYTIAGIMERLHALRLFKTRDFRQI